MGVYANGRLIYGFVHNDETSDLFEAITDAYHGDEEEEVSIEEMHTDLQEKHQIEIYSVGYAGVDILSAFSASASSKGFDDQGIEAKDISQTEEYDRRIAAFLTALEIDPAGYKPGWRILGYMD
jgi:hypothetical protein